MVVELFWNAGMVGAVPSHPHLQCGYVVKGSFESQVDGVKAVLHPGDCVYTEANVPHGLVALEDDSVFLDIFTPCREDFIEQLSHGS
jgi:quercetin dioxygenase-like cupin family protein